MENRTIDQIRRTLVSPTSRRHIFRLLGGGLFGGVTLGAAPRPTAAETIVPRNAIRIPDTLATDDGERYRRNALTPGTYRIRQKSSGRYMDAWVEAAADYRVVTREFQDNHTQRWVMIPEHLGNTGDRPGRGYTIRQLSTSRLVDAYERSDQDFRLVTGPRGDSAPERWVVTPVSGDTYTIRQRSTGRFVDAHEYAGQDFGVVTRDFQDNDTQRWLFDREDD